MKYEVLDQKGKKVGEELLPKEIFNKKMNADLIFQFNQVSYLDRGRSDFWSKERKSL